MEQNVSNIRFIKKSQHLCFSTVQLTKLNDYNDETIIMLTVDTKALGDYFGIVDLVNLGMPEAVCELHMNMFCSKYTNSYKIFIHIILNIYCDITYDLPKLLNVNQFLTNYRLYRPFINCRAFAISGAFVFFAISMNN